LRVHRRYFCGATAQLTAAQAKTQRKKSARGASRGNVDSEGDEESDGDETDSAPRKTSGAKRKSAVLKDKTKKRFPDDIKSVTAKTGKKVSASSSTVSRKRGSAPSSESKSRKKHKAVVDSDDDSSDDDYSPSESADQSSSEDSIQNSTDYDDFKDGEAMKTSIKRSQSRSPAATKKLAPKSPKTRPKSSGEKENKTSKKVEGKDKAKSGKVSKMNPKGKARSKTSVKGKGKVKSEGKGKGKGNGKPVGKSFDDDDESSDSSDSASDDTGSDMEMSDVERDIAEALRKSAANINKSSLLHSVSWFRIILDEAHLIKDRATSTAKAVFNLTSLYKWCLTGTPLQNRVGELYSLVRFLRIDPSAYYYCNYRGCTCKSLHYRFTKGKCQECAHTAMSHYSHFNKHILNPIKRHGYLADGKKAMIKLKEQILDEVLLRRTKVTRADDIQLPTRIVKVRRDCLDEKEEDFYQALYTRSQAQFNTYVRAGTVLNNYAHIFDILIRLRQAVVHPFLVTLNDTRKSEPEMIRPQQSTARAAPPSIEETEEDDVPMCMLCEEEGEDYVEAQCGHGFCRFCITDYLDTLLASSQLSAIPPSTKTSAKTSASSPSVVCPCCRKPITIDILAKNDEDADDDAAPKSRSRKAGTPRSRTGAKPPITPKPNGIIAEPDTLSVWDAHCRRRKSILNKFDLSKFQTSTKMEALMEELHLMIDREPNAKAIVFSQFVNMLDLLDYRIQTEGMHCTKILGSMSVPQRDEVSCSDVSLIVLFKSLRLYRLFSFLKQTVKFEYCSSR
jgi:hypothetical protein